MSTGHALRVPQSPPHLLAAAFVMWKVPARLSCGRPVVGSGPGRGCGMAAGVRGSTAPRPGARLLLLHLPRLPPACTAIPRHGGSCCCVDLRRGPLRLGLSTVRGHLGSGETVAGVDVAREGGGWAATWAPRRRTNRTAAPGTLGEMPSLHRPFETVSSMASEAGGGEGRRRLSITVLLRIRDPGVTCE